MAYDPYLARVREGLEDTLEHHVRTSRAARRWHRYAARCELYYREWLDDPNLEPPSWDFPTYEVPDDLPP